MVISTVMWNMTVISEIMKILFYQELLGASVLGFPDDCNFQDIILR
jgi:hypothetical protein